MLVPFALVSGDAAAQCTDRDGDGYGRPGDASCPAGPETDCNDLDHLTHPGASERCDGLDNDCNDLPDDHPNCDGILDQGAKVGDDILLTEDPNTSESPSVCWTRDGYGVIFSDDRVPKQGDAIFFTRTSPIGQEEAEEHKVIPDSNASADGRMVWTGNNYAMAWRDGRHAAGGSNYEIYFTRLDKSGQVTGEQLRLSQTTETSKIPRIAWSGEEYGVAWNDYSDLSGDYQVFFTRITSEGQKGPLVPLDLDDAKVDQLAVVWDGTYFALLVHKRIPPDFYLSKLLFVQLNAQGQIVNGPRVLRENIDIETPALELTWTGDEYGAWWWLNGTEVMLTRLDRNGDEIDTANVSQGTEFPSAQTFSAVAWNGQEYGLIWHYNQDFPPFHNDQLKFSRVSKEGTMLATDGIKELQISTDTFDLYFGGWLADIVWNGRDYGVFWIDRMRDGSRDLFFTRVAQDRDGDNYYGVEDCLDQDDTIWSVPSSPTSLRFDSAGDVWEWDAPEESGGIGLTLTYDLLRSSAPDDFLDAECVASNTGDTWAADDLPPPEAGHVMYYKAVAKNSCGTSQLVSGANGLPIPVRSCP
jgi:hypothetical protein